MNKPTQLVDGWSIDKQGDNWFVTYTPPDSGRMREFVKLASTAPSDGGNEVKDSALLDWLEEQARNSQTGVSFDYCKYTEDGYVIEKGYRFMCRHFLGERKPTLREAVVAAQQAARPAPPASPAGVPDVFAKLYAAASKGFHTSETCGQDQKYLHKSKFPTLQDLFDFEDAWRKAMLAAPSAPEGDHHG